MASRQSVSSILKPPKVRAPLKEIESVEQDADENTATLAKRKVSFSGMNKIKMYNTGATSLTVHQAPMFDEQISMLSDSSNAEKPKLSGKFEKSDAQISIESTNCTNLEDNGRIIIEYESPNDNMEMTEALSGKILSDTIYTIDNNGSEHISYSSDYSENNMEFTEALQGGLILSGNNSCNSLSSTEMSETLDDESYDELVSQSGLKPSKPLSDVLITNPMSITSSSSCMDFTCANTKSNLLYNTQSNNMELTEQMTLKSSNCIWSNDDYKSLSMELTQLPDRQTFEDNCELVYEHSQHSVSMGSDISCETQENKNCELEIVVQSEKLEKNNFNSQFIGCELNNSDNGETFIEELSSSMVSMDIDPTLEGNEFDISYVNVNNPLIVVNDQNNSTISMPVGIEDSGNPEKSVLDNYSNVIEISNQNSESRLSIFPTGSSFVVNMSPENNLDKYVEVEELQQTLHGHTSVLDQNQYLENKSIVVEKHAPKKYSRKTMIHPCPLIVQDKSNENEDKPATVNSNEQKYYSRKSIAPTTVFNGYLSDTSEDTSEKFEEEQEKYSRKSITPMSPFHQTQSLETEHLSDTSGIVEDNKKIQCSRKSVAPTFVFKEDVLDTSETLEENEQQKCSLPSIAMSVFNKTQPLETENLSDTSGTVKENQQNKYSRKSVAPTSVFNEDVLDTSETLEENQQCSLQSIAMSVLSQSLKTKDVSNTSVYNPIELAEICDTSECSLNQSAEKEETSLHNSTQSAVKDETSLYNSTQSAKMDDTSAIVEKYELKKYSRKSLGPTSLVFTHCESLDSSTLNNSLDTELDTEENNEPTFEKGISPVIPVPVNNLSILQSDVSSYDEENSIPKSKHQTVLLNIISDDNLNSPFRKKQKKSIVLTHSIRLPVEDPSITNELETTDENISGNFENASKMDISIENELKNDNELLVVSKEGEEPFKNIVHDDMFETNKENIVLALNELEINKTNLNELVENNDIFRESENKNEENNENNSIKVTDNHILNSDYHSHSYSEDKSTKSICVKDISMDETFQNNEKSCLVNRKRSYSNRDCAPLSCSSFISKPNINNSMEEDLNTDDFIQQSPIKNDIINKSLTSEKLEIINEIQVGLIKKESIKESLCNEGLEFLTRWNEQFIKNKLVLDKCTNREWIFNLLDNNILLTVTYAYISNDYTFLKVEDISFTAKTIIKNEIIQFGINWILSKYNPKVYKQICFTSRDVELLLKSLLEDVHFISKVMNNMSYVRDIYCVTFKDNKAQFVIHNMNCPLMVRIEITLSNIHKLSIKDLSVDCLFGYFNTQLLEEIMEDISKDSNVLQSLVEKLTKLYSHRQN